jgi:hypothetical protein
MDWEFVARYGGRYTVLFGGGTVGVAYLLPSRIRPYALLGTITVGLLLMWRAAAGGKGGGPTLAQEPEAVSGLKSRDDSVVVHEENEPLGARKAFFALGLIVFGVGALVTLM